MWHCQFYVMLISRLVANIKHATPQHDDTKGLWPHARLLGRGRGPRGCTTLNGPEVEPSERAKDATSEATYIINQCYLHVVHVSTWNKPLKLIYDRNTMAELEQSGVHSRAKLPLARSYVRFQGPTEQRPKQTSPKLTFQRNGC